ncbi:MAG TPA: PQQ-binding-like beta-propeller repeat protein [Micromonosporaceae bacterium]
MAVPTPPGAAARSTVTPVWSVDLRQFGGHGVVVDPAGGCLTHTESALVSFTVDGRVRWQAPRLGPVHGNPQIAPDGSILQLEGGDLVTRDGRSGQVVATFRAPSAHWITLDPWGGILFNETVFDQAGKSSDILHRSDRSGGHTWSIALSSPASALPTVLGQLVLVHSGGLLRGIDSAGQVRMAVGHDGFQPPQTTARDSGVADELWHRPQWFGPTTILVGLRWYSSSRQLFLIDPWASAITPFAQGLAPGEPLTTLPAGAAARVALRGDDRELREMEFEHSVVGLDETGRQVWQHWLHAPPTALLPGSGGTLFVAGSPSQRRWDDYHRMQDLSAQTYVRCLGPDGSPRWTWFAPGPQSQPQLGPDGTVYVVSQDTLYGLPGS